MNISESKECKQSKKRYVLNLRTWHRWAGLVLSVMIILFCASGIVMNHRKAFASFEVSRSWLPESYHIKDWNQGILKGTLDVEGNRVGRADSTSRIIYGQAGLWLTDTQYRHCEDFNRGIAEGIDNRKICNLVQTRDGRLWCAGLYNAYTYNNITGEWETVILPDNEERVSDIAIRGQDTVIVMTRSQIYEAVAPSYSFRRLILAAPDGYKPEVTLFKTFWMLHSGDLFGLAGRLVVDALGVILIILCLTGIIFFVARIDLRRVSSRRKSDKKVAHASIRQHTRCMKWSMKWHMRLGAWTIMLTLILSITGMCLRPPLMVPLAITRIPPLPGSTLADENVFHDKLRAIRWDDRMNQWVISTSEGFYLLDNLQDGKPKAIDADKAPVVSPMGVNVFCQDGEDWLVGSFSGLFRWNIADGSVTDYYTGEAYRQPTGRPIGTHAVTGIAESPKGETVVFEYNNAPNRLMPPMPTELANQPMSLWNFALELHVGRCYEPFLGSVFSVLYVFIAGLLLTLILLSGYIVNKKRNK